MPSRTTPLFGEVLERVADAFKDSQDARRRNPPQ